MGPPCYMRGDRNIALISAFREDFRLTFMNAALLEDPEGVLEKNGPNTQHASVIRFTADEQVAKLEPSVRAYLEEAIGYADGGVKPKKEIAEFELPEELVDALDADPELAEAFEDLTPGRQRSYVINLNGAKQSSTRLARIAKFRDKIIAGKGRAGVLSGARHLPCGSPRGRETRRPPSPEVPACPTPVST